MEDLPNAAPVQISVGGAAFTLIADGLGFGDLNLDNRRGDMVPTVGVGDDVFVSLGDGVVLSGSLWMKGDANSDGSFNTSDVVFMLIYLFLGGRPPVDWQDLSGDQEIEPTCVRVEPEDDCETSHAICE